MTRSIALRNGLSYATIRNASSDSCSPRLNNPPSYH